MGTLKRMKEAVKMAGTGCLIYCITSLSFRVGIQCRNYLFQQITSKFIYEFCKETQHPKIHGRKSKRNICKTNTAHSKQILSRLSSMLGVLLVGRDICPQESSVLSDWALKNNEINCPGFLQRHTQYKKLKMWNWYCKDLFLLDLTIAKCHFFLQYKKRDWMHMHNKINKCVCVYKLFFYNLSTINFQLKLH